LAAPARPVNVKFRASPGRNPFYAIYVQPHSAAIHPQNPSSQPFFVVEMSNPSPSSPHDWLADGSLLPFVQGASKFHSEFLWLNPQSSANNGQ
jgi:hypothetical protein